MAVNRLFTGRIAVLCKQSAQIRFAARQVNRTTLERLFFSFGLRFAPSSSSLRNSLTDSWRRGLSSSSDPTSTKNENQGFETVIDLVKSKLDVKHGDSGAFTTQMNIVKALVEHKKGNIKSSDVSSITESLTPKELYELGATIFDTSGTVGNDAVELSVPLFRLACIRGDTDAKYSYAQLLQAGHGTDPDPIEAAKLFTELAQKGHPYAQYTLGQMYYLGHGTEQDFKAAFSLFEVSATNGLFQAFSNLGLMYKQGQGIGQDLQKAAEYFRRGAEKGDVPALMHLAHCYSHGSGVEVDYKKAFECHSSAADTGHGPAVHNVGVHYFAGRGVGLDMKKAAEYFTEAAEAGFELSLINLGNMYYNGLGVEKDWERAKELYSRAAPSNKQAQLLLEELQDEMGKKTKT